MLNVENAWHNWIEFIRVCIIQFILLQPSRSETYVQLTSHNIHSTIVNTYNTYNTVQYSGVYSQSIQWCFYSLQYPTELDWCRAILQVLEILHIRTAILERFKPTLYTAITLPPRILKP